jgi:hypothetical protein
MPRTALSSCRSTRRCRRAAGFLVELIHKDALRADWVPATVTETDDGILIDRRAFDPLTGRADARRTIVRDGRVRRFSFFVRLFSFTAHATGSSRPA